MNRAVELAKALPGWWWEVPSRFGKAVFLAAALAVIGAVAGFLYVLARGVGAILG